MRENGFGHKELGVEELDDVYLAIVEDAIAQAELLPVRKSGTPACLSRGSCAVWGVLVAAASGIIAERFFGTANLGKSFVLIVAGICIGFCLKTVIGGSTDESSSS